MVGGSQKRAFVQMQTIAPITIRTSTRPSGAGRLLNCAFLRIATRVYRNAQFKSRLCAMALYEYLPRRKNMKAFVAVLMLFMSSMAVAAEKGSPSLDLYKGFSYQGKAINPKCVNLLQTWISESPEYGIITKSIVIDSCQDSNLAFEGKDYSVSENGTVSYYDDPEDGHTYFGYRVVGRTLNNVFVLFHSGYIGLYRLNETNVIFDFSKNSAKSVQVLTKLSHAWMPCFISAEIRENTLLIVKDIWDSSAPSASQCTGVSETLTFNLSDF